MIIGGLGFASLMTLYLTPVLYDLMAGFTRPRGAVEKALEAELIRRGLLLRRRSDGWSNAFGLLNTGSNGR